MSGGWSRSPSNSPSTTSNSPTSSTFWPELNAYRVPKNHLAYYQLAQQHRCVANCWTPRPKLEGEGKDMKVIWEDYDKNFGPLLDGSAFKDNRRGRRADSSACTCRSRTPGRRRCRPRPTTTRARWAKKGDGNDVLVEHVLTSPYIGDALSQDYKDAFLAVQKQFVEHFKAKGWDKTEMQCFYGGKKTHRTEYGTNMWWTTDEPYHWDDWMALEFFCRFWTQGRDATRCRPRTVEGPRRHQPAQLAGQDPGRHGAHGLLRRVQLARYSRKRCRLLEQETGLKLMTYGGASADNASNTQSLAMLVDLWLAGSNGHLPWQTFGSDAALDTNDAGAFGGNALLVPGDRFGVPVVADMRIKAFRDGQQIIEYMAILAKKRGLQREQIQAMVADAIRIEASRKEGANADDADAMRFSAEGLADRALRQRLAEMIAK